jgi:phage shock protein PspC (stress-responsive transcriptional regulator)
MAQSRRLYRSRTNRKLAGVCGGLARYFNTDPTLIRCCCGARAAWGPGLVIYLLMWIIVPEEPQGAT